jgi:hypothetical protein
MRKYGMKPWSAVAQLPFWRGAPVMGPGIWVRRSMNECSARRSAPNEGGSCAAALQGAQARPDRAGEKLRFKFLAGPKWRRASARHYRFGLEPLLPKTRAGRSAPNAAAARISRHAAGRLPTGPLACSQARRRCAMMHNASRHTTSSDRSHSVGMLPRIRHHWTCHRRDTPESQLNPPDRRAGLPVTRSAWIAFPNTHP